MPIIIVFKCSLLEAAHVLMHLHSQKDIHYVAR